MRSSDLLCHRTPRLDLLVDLTKKYKTVADIGCDHAYLSILLARCGVRVIASDVAQGPRDKAMENIRRFGFEAEIDLRLGDGLLTLAPGETDAVVIAGMGGLVIADILAAGKHLLRADTRLFLQPMRADEDLRKYLYENGFVILAEHLVREQRRIYTVLEVQMGSTGSFTAFDCAFSPALREGRVPLFSDYFLWKKRILADIIENTAQAEDADLQKEFTEKMQAYIAFEGEIRNEM